jgi:hypothetical protein
MAVAGSYMTVTTAGQLHACYADSRPAASAKTPLAIAV